MLTSFWLASSFKNDHSAWLQLGFFLQIRQLLHAIYLFIFPTFYSSAMVMDDKAHGVSGVPRTKALWPSALAWLCQSLALLTAEWNGEWYSMPSRELPHVANRDAAGELRGNFGKTMFWWRMPLGTLTLLLRRLRGPFETFVALSWLGRNSHKHKQILTLNPLNVKCEFSLAVNASRKWQLRS